MKIRAIQTTIMSGAFYRRFARFLGVGIVATIIDWLIFYALIQYTSIFYMLALATSYLASTAFSFFMNRRYTFRSAYKKVHVQLASFFAVALMGLAINELLVFAMASYLFGQAGTGLMAARIIATLIVFIWNFTLNDRVTFRIFR